jgi:GT2 family glycosyltransferase
MAGEDMRIFIIIPTVGRAESVRRAVQWLEQQTRLPDGILVIGATPGDIAGCADATHLPLECMIGSKGSSAQRNVGLDRAEGRADIALFFDDDFVPAPDYIAQVEKAFVEEPALVGLTGRLIADGVHGTGLSFDQAFALIRAYVPPHVPLRAPRLGLYGCNMAIRLSAAQGIRFDERLPLYGWQEDVDYSFQVGRRGTMALDEHMVGVHLGLKQGRTSGKRFGYSQIANPVYLLGKQTIPPRRAYRIMWRNVSSNLVRSLRPEAHIDRRGRLLGNALAIVDLATGRLKPERILEL